MDHERRKNDEMILVAIARIEGQIDRLKQLGELTLEQTRKTNGRVTKVEEEVETLKIINAGVEGEKKAIKPYQTFGLSVTASVLTAIIIAWVMK